MTPDKDDSPSVVGADITPVPTDEQHKAAFKREYIRLLAELGVDEKDAANCFDAVEWEDMKKWTPAEAVADETSYWDNE